MKHFYYVVYEQTPKSGFELESPACGIFGSMSRVKLIVSQIVSVSSELTEEFSRIIALTLRSIRSCQRADHVVCKISSFSLVYSLLKYRIMFTRGDRNAVTKLFKHTFCVQRAYETWR